MTIAVAVTVADRRMSSNDRGSGRVFSLEQNERAREKLRQLLETRYDGNQSDLSKALNVAQATVSNFLKGKTVEEAA